MGTLPDFPAGMVIRQHGSWNRSKLSGYKVVFVPFENGKPSGPSRDILWGFLALDESVSYGRPVGVTLGPDNSLLMADYVRNVIWRVTAASGASSRRFWFLDNVTPTLALEEWWRTYDRLVARWEAVEQKADALWEPRTLRLLTRMMGVL